MKPLPESNREQLTHLNPKGAYVDLSQLLRLRFAAQDFRLFVKRAVKSQLNGAERTRFRGRGMDFEEVRLYQAGDDVRSIDWRVTARTQVPHTKLYCEERERPVWVMVDQRSPMFFGSQQCFKSVLAAHIAANLAWAALGNGDRLGGFVFGDQSHADIRPKRSKHAVLDLLQKLQSFNQQLNTPIASTNTKSLSDFFTDTRRLAKPGSALFIISDFHDYDAACEQQLYALARHTDITLIHVFDPLEKNLRSHSRLSISNGSTQMQLPTNDVRFQQAFTQAFNTDVENLVASAKRLSLPVLSYATTDNLQQLLRDRFARIK